MFCCVHTCLAFLLMTPSHPIVGDEKQGRGTGTVATPAVVVQMLTSLSR